MKYRYQLNNKGKKKKLVIDMSFEDKEGDYSTVVEYNKYERPTIEIHLGEKPTDTLESMIYIYSDSIINKYFHKKHHGYRENSFALYNDHENVTFDKETKYEFDSDQTLEIIECEFYYNDKQELIRSEERELLTGAKKSYRYIRER